MTAHLSEDDLILHFYGESPQPDAVKTHLAFCATCANEFEAVAETLALVTAPAIPERGDLYGLEVWQRIRPILPPPLPFWRAMFRRPTDLAAAAVVVLLIVIGFVAGRTWPRPDSTAEGQGALFADAMDGADRARGAAIADHLERSERILLELSNAEGSSVDVSAQQAWAADLVDANRLYRDAAAQAGDTIVASVLDDLERNLLDIVHAPSKLTSADLEDVRARLEAAALLFKLRVLSNELRERDTTTPARRNIT